MKKGDTFGILDKTYKKQHSLYCEVKSIEGSVLNGYVINGNWNFILDIHKGEAVILTPWGNRLDTGWKIGYVGPIPNSKYYDYNTAMQYMDDQLKKGVFVLYWIRLKWEASYYYNRFVKSCRAFKQAWQGTLVPKDNTVIAGFEDLNADIPF